MDWLDIWNGASTTGKAVLIVLLVMVVLLIAVMLTLMVCAVNLSTAHKKGEMIRESCGMEYLEAETERREVQMAWDGENGVERIFKATLVMFLGMAGLGLLALSMDILFRALSKTGEGVNREFVYKGFKQAGLCIAGIVIIFSLVTLQTIAGLVMGGKWWQDTSNDLDGYLKQKVYAPLTTVIGTAGLASIVGLGILQSNGEDILQEWGLLGITVFVLAFLIPLFKQYTYFKFYIEDYKKKGEAVMAAIGPVEGPVAQYINQNKADYGKTDGEDFTYIMHRDGKEGEFLPLEDLASGVVDAIKGKVKTLLTDLITDPTLRDSLFANFTTNIATASTDLAGDLSIAGERLKEVVANSLGSDVVKICSLVKLGRENPACDGRALLKNALAAHLRWIQTNSGGKGLTYGVWKAKIADFIESNVLIDSDTIIPRENAKTVASKALELDAKEANNNRDVGDGDVVAAGTIDGLVAKLTAAAGLTSTNIADQAQLTQFNQAVLGKSIAEFVADKVNEMLDLVKLQSDKRTGLQKAMLALRQHPLPTEAKKFVDIIYPFCVLIVVVGLGAGFAWVFSTTKESGKGVVFASLAMMLLMVVMAITGWFIGVYWLQ